MEKLKFNQCQDCGCTGAQLVIEDWDDRYAVVVCPYCKRRGAPFLKPARGQTKGFPSPLLAIASWNSYNRDNEGW